MADASYLGHMINDGASVGGIGTPLDLRFTLPKYVEESARKSNVAFSNVDGLHGIVKATRKIHAGEELLVSYGPRYWTSRLQRRTARIVSAFSSVLG